MLLLSGEILKENFALLQQTSLYCTAIEAWRRGAEEQQQTSKVALFFRIRLLSFRCQNELNASRSKAKGNFLGGP